MTMHRLVAILSLATLLAGCGGILSEVPKRQIYRTNPSFAFAASGGAALMSGSLDGGVAPTWQIDPSASPVFNRAFQDWHADFFSTLRRRSRH